MPGYFTVLYLGLKTLATLYFFGPSSPDAVQKWFHDPLFAAFLSMFLYVIYTDMQQIWDKGLECAPVVLYCSSNVPTSFALSTMSFIYSGARRFREAHENSSAAPFKALQVDEVATLMHNGKGRIAG